MSESPLLTPCPACDNASLAWTGQAYCCENCQLTVTKKKQRWPFGSKTEQYIVQDISTDYSIARSSLVGQTVSMTELQNFTESVYTDAVLAEFAEGEFENMTMPASTLAQILLEQLRETCFMQVSGVRRAHGPVLEAGGDRFPSGTVPKSNMTWQDEGNLFLTNIRMVLPSNSFTFIRLDRKITGFQTFEDGIAVQRKGEEFATYFVGCRAHQAALVAAYVVGKIPQLRKETA